MYYRQRVSEAEVKIGRVAWNNNHRLGKWEWNDFGYWQAFCKKPECFAYGWVDTLGNSGGLVVNTRCWGKALRRRRRQS